MTNWDMLQNCKMVDLSVTVSPDLPSGWPTHMPFAAKVWNYYSELTDAPGTAVAAPGTGVLFAQLPYYDQRLLHRSTAIARHAGDGGRPHHVLGRLSLQYE